MWKQAVGFGASPLVMELPRSKGFILSELLTEATDVPRGSVAQWLEEAHATWGPGERAAPLTSMVDSPTPVLGYWGPMARV